MSHNEGNGPGDKGKATASAGYEVGYGKPPKQHQFKKGCKSPNPKGRPKGAKSLKTIVCEAAEATTEFFLNGKKTKGTRLQVALQQLALKAAKGDPKATGKLIELYAQYGPPPPVDESTIDPVADAAALDELVKRAMKFGKGLDQ